MDVCRVFSIEMPAKRIGLDVISDIGQRIFHPNDVFVKAPLPHMAAGTAAELVDAPRRKSFESSDYLSQSMELRERRNIRIQNEDTVDVIWHDHECIQLDVGVVRWQCMPGFVDDLAKSIQMHRFFSDVSKETGAAIRANCYEINSRAVVVVTG